jgi:DNA-binding transcriptional LysR family regulator
MDSDNGPLRRLNLNLIYSLDAILNATSLTEAGRRVSLGQPAMSAALRKLRDQFDDQLVVYIGADRVLTPLAKALRPRVGRLLREMDETFRLRLEFDPPSAVRSFRIAASEALETMLLGRVIPAMLREAPHIDFQVLALDHEEPGRAFALGADLIVVPDRFADDRYCSRSLFVHEPACMVWDEHPEVSDSISEAQYLALPHVALHDPLWPSNHIEPSARALLAQRRIRVQTGLHAALPGLLIGTNLVATASGWLLQHQASTLPLRVMSAPFPTTAEMIVAQWPQHSEDDPAHRWLLSHVIDATSMFRQHRQDDHSG